MDTEPFGRQTVDLRDLTAQRAVMAKRIGVINVLMGVFFLGAGYVGYSFIPNEKDREVRIFFLSVIALLIAATIALFVLRGWIYIRARALDRAISAERAARAAQAWRQMNP